MESSSKQPSITYAEAGVNIDAGNELVERIKPYARKTLRPEVLTGIGGFGALCQIPQNYREPVLVSGTDGVGTKLKLAIKMQKHDTIGIDLVAMCVNDILVSGAEPLFFLDYFATSHLDPLTASEVVKGIAEGCLQANCALVGGETAEMPGLYQKHDYDLAGFCVGVVEKSAIINGQSAESGDCLIGIASSGPHSNGYSLIHKILDNFAVDLATPFGEKTIGETLLTPTQIYCRPILQLLQQFTVKAMAHITGGGLVENPPRVFPKHLQAVIQKDSWPIPPIFHWLREKANIEEMEMLRTFNCGIGMVLCVNKTDGQAIIDALGNQRLSAWEIGYLQDTPTNTINHVVFK